MAGVLKIETSSFFVFSLLQRRIRSENAVLAFAVCLQV